MPRDVGRELTIELGERVSALQLVVEEFEIYYSFRCGTDGRGVFQVNGEDERAFSLSRLQVGRSYEIAFGYLDGEFFLELDGRLVQVPFALGEPVPIQVPTTAPARLRNLLHVGLIGAEEATATMTRVTVFHDIYYPPEADPFHLEEDQVFLLGDNAVDSTDSRDFRFRDAHASRLTGTSPPAVGQFEIADLIGRPIAIIHPANRRRSLSR